MITHIKSLTSLRGIAALIVVVYHFAYTLFPNTGAVLSAYTGAIFRHGYICVDFFFMLSGFVMTHVYGQFESSVSSSDYWTYLRSRFARIYPLHLFTLLLFIGLEFAKFSIPDTQPFTGNFNLTALFANIVFLQAFALDCPPLFWCNTYWNEPAWSVSVEFVIYCLFPIGLLWLTKYRRFNLFIYLSALVFSFLLIKFTQGNLGAIIGIPSIARCGLECLMGMTIYQIYDRDNYRQYISPDLLATISIVWLLGLMAYWHDNWRSVHDWLMLIGCSGLILATSTQSKSWISKILWSRLLVYLGTISYSIYLVHWFIAISFKDVWKYLFKVDFSHVELSYAQSILTIGAFVAIVVSCSALTYRAIESPMRRYLKPLA